MQNDVAHGQAASIAQEPPRVDELFLSREAIPVQFKSAGDWCCALRGRAPS